MAYYDLTQVKLELNKVGVTTYDDLLNQYGAQADNDINDMIFAYVSATPVVPTPDKLRDASNMRVIASWWLYNRNKALYDEFMAKSNAKVQEYLQAKSKSGSSDRTPQKFSKTAGTSLGTDCP